MSTEQVSISCGVAKKCTNPEAGAPLVGFPSAGGRGNRGVGMDLTLRCAVFGESEGSTPAAALLVLDSLGITPDLIARIREAVQEAIPALKAESICVAATHTHSAPSLRNVAVDPSEPSGKFIPPVESYAATVVKAAREAALEAMSNRFQGALSLGLTEARLGHNRRVVDKNGQARNEWLDEERIHIGYVNPNVRILVVRDQTGQIRSILSGYGCHPVTLGPENVLCHPDYPGVLVRELEKVTGADVAFHITSGGADINPYDGLLPTADGAERMGRALAESVLETIPHLRPIQAAPVCAARKDLHLPANPTAPPAYESRVSCIDGKSLVRSEMMAIRLGEVVLVSAPGELFARIGSGIEYAAPCRAAFVVGYANDYLGYLVTDEVIREGGYESANLVATSFEAPIIQTARTLMEETMG